jgi:hypothetical protein
MRLRHSCFFDVEVAVTPLDQLRLRLPDHEFDRLMQAAKPAAEPDREAHCGVNLNEVPRGVDTNAPIA